MPPRYAYWTIIVDNQPTAFRSGAKEDLLPTFNRLKAKNDTAVMMWFQNGKLWPSRVDAQEAMIGRGEMGRRSDPRQAGTGFRDRERRPTLDRSGSSVRPEWRPKPHKSEAKGQGPRRSAEREGGLDWKPKGEFTPAPRRSEKPDWKPKSFKRPDFKPSADGSRSAKPEWKPKGSFDRKAEWKPRASFDRGAKPEWKSKSAGPSTYAKASADKQARKPSGRLEWKPRGEGTPAPSHPRTPAPEKRKWVPKEEYKKSMGIEAKRDSKWRPGGEHKDPRQKYKDAKKAKWSKFKQNIRARSGGKGKKSS